jgi:hypothetical protein
MAHAKNTYTWHNTVGHTSDLADTKRAAFKHRLRAANDIILNVLIYCLVLDSGSAGAQQRSMESVLQRSISLAQRLMLSRRCSEMEA